MVARASQFFNVCIFGSLLGLIMIGSRPGAFMANAQDPASPQPGVVAAPQPGVPPVVAPLSGSGVKGDAIVPPIVRKRPPPGQLTAPIVAQPSRKGTQAAKSKPRPAPQPGRASLGVKPDPALKCASGLKYDAKLLKCAKPAGTARAVAVKAAVKPKRQ